MTEVKLSTVLENSMLGLVFIADFYVLWSWNVFEVVLLWLFWVIHLWISVSICSKGWKKMWVFNMWRCHCAPYCWYLEKHTILFVMQLNSPSHRWLCSHCWKSIWCWTLCLFFTCWNSVSLSVLQWKLYRFPPLSWQSCDCHATFLWLSHRKWRRLVVMLRNGPCVPWNQEVI